MDFYFEFQIEEPKESFTVNEEIKDSENKTVSKMLGHRNIKTTQHYAKIYDMRSLRFKFS